MKVKLLLNLENFQNITFVSNNDKDRLDAYEELLPCVEDWVGYTPYALKLANRIRKILSLDPYEVENEEQFNKETIITQEVTIPKKGKYTWYPIASGGKVRKCNNKPCPYFLKYNEDMKTYQHGKYDDVKEEWYYVDDTCEFYDGGG